MTSKAKSKKAGANVVVKAGRAVGSLMKLVGRLLVAAPAQFWFVVVIAVIAAVAYFFFQDDTGKLVGWSAIPLGLWLVVASFLVVFKRTQLFERWRWVVSSLASAIAISGGLGIFYAPLASFSGDTLGGDVGVAIARAPFEWDRFDVGIAEYAAAWARVVVLLVIAFAVASPDMAKRTGSGVLSAGIFVFAMIASGAQSLYASF
ncbi:MAG: hypothetical protein V3T49_03325, partial [Dehalococcoidia bacterium]